MLLRSEKWKQTISLSFKSFNFSTVCTFPFCFKSDEDQCSFGFCSCYYPFHGVVISVVYLIHCTRITKYELLGFLYMVSCLWMDVCEFGSVPGDRAQWEIIIYVLLLWFLFSKVMHVTGIRDWHPITDAADLMLKSNILWRVSDPNLQAWVVHVHSWRVGEVRLNE